MKSFFKEAVSTIKTTGTIKPASKFLIKDCLKDFDFSEKRVILEFGPGNGCFTSVLADRLNAESLLYSFEINDKFYQFCQRKFADRPNVHVLKISAFDFVRVLKENDIEQADYIVSSLPLALLKKEDIAVLLENVRKYLKPGGSFVQYQYSLGNYRKMKKNFEEVNLGLTVRNIPPAFIYRCYGE